MLGNVPANIVQAEHKKNHVWSKGVKLEFYSKKAYVQNQFWESLA